MAERRMFAKTIIDSDAFVDMPLSTQALYFHLSMRADDDGFINNPKKIQRMIGASDDDLKMLVAKRFIIPFESGIVVIKHWKIHNYIRGDRKKETVYPEEMALLEEKENGAYTLKAEEPIPIEVETNETKRQKAYRESSLPYSFEYKIRQAFYGEICPICGCKMCGSVDECGIETNNRRPSIQHNKPISKGGKHELGNISVICHQCNITLQDTETGRLNADKVIEKWDEICMAGKCPSNDGQVSGRSQRRIGEDKLGEDSLGQGSVVEENTLPTLQQIKDYVKEHSLNVDPDRFFSYYSKTGWKTTKGNPIDWQDKLKEWSSTEKKEDKPQKSSNPFLDALKKGEV